MTKQFIITMGLENIDIGQIVQSTGHYLDVEDSKIVYFITASKDGRYTSVIIPGIVMSDEYRTENTRAIKVEPITDPQFKDKINKLLGSKENISFW
jgi:hypothetical protein